MSPAAVSVRECILSGTIFIALCATVVVPLLAIAGTRIIGRCVARMDDDPLWQAPLAAFGAALPGMLFFVVALTGLVTGWRSPCMTLVAGRLLYAALATVTAGASIRAMFIVASELAYSKRLRSASRAPSKRLADSASSARITAREIDTAASIFALVGVLRPVVVASTAVAAHMSDAQLYAALRHEAAHRDRYDGIVSLLLLFFSSVVPARIPLVATYHRARELAADSLAVRSSNNLDLATAITVMARTRCASMPALSGDGDIQARVYRLVENRPDVPQAASRTTVLLSLASTAALGFAPLAVGALQLLSCTGVPAR